MADAEALAGWLHVDVARIPASPESLANPKETLLALAHKSTSREIRSDLLPSPKSGRQTGPLYATRLQEFIGESWDISRAAASGRAPSLQKALSCLQRVVADHRKAYGPAQSRNGAN